MPAWQNRLATPHQAHVPAVARAVEHSACLRPLALRPNWPCSTQVLRQRTVPSSLAQPDRHDPCCECQWPPSPDITSRPRIILPPARTAGLWHSGRADCARPITHLRALFRQEISLLRQAIIVRRANCGFQRQAGGRVYRARVNLCSSSLGRRRSTQAYCACAPRRAGCDGLSPIKDVTDGNMGSTIPKLVGRESARHHGRWSAHVLAARLSSLWAS